MNRKEILLVGAILLLGGVLIGLLVPMFVPDGWSGDTAELRVTEVQRSSQPLFSREDLETIDSRFLFQKVAEEVTPTVVYVETTVPVRGRGVDEEEEEDLWHRFLPRRARTVGSGVILTSDGYILTNNHVIESAVGSGIHVTLSDKRSYPARIVGTDPSTDLAVIRIDAENLPVAVLGNSDQVRVGEWVLAVGNPFRLRSTVTAGIVSALGRDVQIINDAMRIESFIQTDAAINRGNSGGALVNTSGELIGINTAIATQSGAYQGYGFAVPSNLALKVAGDLMEFGELRRGMLGITIESVNHAIARDIGLDRIRGVLVVNAPRDGAAWDAGLRRNDVVLSVNGAEVNEANQLQEKVALHRPGDYLDLEIWRGGDTFSRQVELRELARPEIPVRDEVPELREPPSERFDPELEEYEFEPGFSVSPLPFETDEAAPGLLITRVERGSPAWQRGLRPDYHLLEIDGVPLYSPDQIEELLSHARTHTGFVRLMIRTSDEAIAHLILE